MARFHMNNIVDYKRLDKINVGHNLTDAFDFHDVVRTLIVRMQRRKHQNKRMNPIYTEFDPSKPNEDYPDIWMKIGKDVYVWEIQEKISKDWERRIVQQYEEVNLTIVPLEKVRYKWMVNMKEGLLFRDPIEILKTILEEYII